MGNKKPKKESAKKGRKASTTGQATPSTSQPTSAGTEQQQQNIQQHIQPPPEQSHPSQQDQLSQQRAGSNTPSLSKKEFQPLTPRSEPITETTKKKRKGSKISETSPKKQSKAAPNTNSNGNSKLDSVIKEETELNLKKDEPDLDLNPPPAPTQTTISGSFNDATDQIFDVNLLDSGSSHNQNGNHSSTNSHGTAGGGVFGDSNQGFDDINFNIDDIWNGTGTGDVDGSLNDSFNAINWNVDAIEGGE
jgi:hypothetical protein